MLGDSMVKHVQGWDITNRIGIKRKVYVRQFSGSKVDCMKDYMKPCIRENNPDHLIFHLMEVNSYLKDLCERNDIRFISNTTINPKKHLNNSRLHLNPKGSNKLRDNFVRYLKGLTS